MLISVLLNFESRLLSLQNWLQLLFHATLQRRGASTLGVVSNYLISEHEQKTHFGRLALYLSRVLIIIGC